MVASWSISEEKYISSAGVPDFSWYVIPKTEKGTKATQKVPNYPNWDFWFENKPSGNHDPK
jgi:hypothetical protein